MLIRDAELWPHDGSASGRRADVRLADGAIRAIGALEPERGETIVEAGGAALLPGLHDHHIHLFALAVSLSSVACGPPHVANGDALVAQLRAAGGSGWLRGVGYHDSVAGDIDRAWLDRAVPDRPVRIQHRGGRLWIMNSLGLEALTRGVAVLPAGLERRDGALTGRLYDADPWIRERLGGAMPDLARVSTMLAGFGVTGVTDMTPSNDAAAIDFLAAQQSSGCLMQVVYVAGRGTLPELETAALTVLATKLHLHEGWLPDFEAMRDRIADSHAIGRPVAIHCVTRTELVFALATLREAGTVYGDRIEHASVAPPDLVEQIAELGLAVVGQPNFIAERGDAYRSSVEAEDLPWLYRARAFIARGIPFASGTDAPFGDCDPWRAIRAATDRRTAADHVMGSGEILSPEEAMGMFLADPRDVRAQRRIAVGASADLCLLDRPWRAARAHLDSGLVRLTVRAGVVIHGHL